MANEYEHQLKEISTQLTQQVAQLQAAIVANDAEAIKAAADAIEATALSLTQCLERIEETAPPSAEEGTSGGPPMAPVPPVA